MAQWLVEVKPGLLVEGVWSVHRRAGILIKPTKQLAIVMTGITAVHIKEHADSLLPNRKGPTGPDLYRQIDDTPDGRGTTRAIYARLSPGGYSTWTSTAH